MIRSSSLSHPRPPFLDSLAFRAVVLGGLGVSLPLPAQATEDRAGRIELVTTSTLFGVGLGVWSSVELDLNPRPAAWVSAALAGGMLYGSYTLADRLALTTANVRYVETSGAWLAVNTVLLGGALEADTSLMVWTGFGAAAAGSGAALATYGSVHASEGQLSLVNTGGIFLPVAGLLTGLTLHLGDGSHLFRDLLVLNLAGLGTGLALTSRYDPTREQVLYLDGGMLAGGLCGGLVGAMAAVLSNTWEVISGTAVVGMGLGGWLAVRAQGFDRRGARATDPPVDGETAKQAARVFMFPVTAGRF